MANPPKWYVGYTCDEVGRTRQAPCRDFTPSYDLDGLNADQRFNEYNERVEACKEAQENEEWDKYVQLGCKREGHLYVPGGRSAQRYVDVSYPVQPCKGGPGRNRSDGISGRTTPGESTITRWEEYEEDLSRRTQGQINTRRNPRIEEDEDGEESEQDFDFEREEELPQDRSACRAPLSIQQQIENALVAWGKKQYPEERDATRLSEFAGKSIVLPDVPYPLIDLGMPRRAALLLMRRQGKRSQVEARIVTKLQPVDRILAATGTLRINDNNQIQQRETRKVIRSIQADGMPLANVKDIENQIQDFKKPYLEARGDLGLELTKTETGVWVTKEPTRIRTRKGVDVESPFAGSVLPGDEFVSLYIPQEKRLLQVSDFGQPERFTEFVRRLPIGMSVVLKVRRLNQERTYSAKVLESARSLRVVIPTAILDAFLGEYFSKLMEEAQGARVLRIEFVDPIDKNQPVSSVLVDLAKREHSILQGKRGKPVSSDYRTLDGIDLQDLPEVLARMVRRKTNHRTKERKLAVMSSRKSEALENPDLPTGQTLWGMDYEQLKAFVKRHGSAIPLPWNNKKVLYYSEKRDKLIVTTPKRAATWSSFRKTYDAQGKPVTPQACPVCPPCQPGSSNLPEPITTLRENPMNQTDLAVLERAYQLAEHHDDLGDVLKTAWDEIHLGVKTNPRRRSRAASAKQKAARARNRKILKHAHALLRKSPRLSLKTAVARAHAAVAGKRSRKNPVDYTDTTMVRSALSQAVDYEDPSMIRSALVNPDTTMVRSALSRAVNYEDPTMIRSALMNPDTTMIRSALSTAVDYEDPTMIRSALQNPGAFGLDSDYSDHHPVYEQFDGQFSTSEAFTYGIQPMNRRNPRKSRKARHNPIGEFRIEGDYSEHHPVYEQFDAQFSTSEPFTQGIQPMNRRNPRKSRKAKARHNPIGEFSIDGDYSEHHPVYEQFDAQFSTSEPFTQGIQPMNRRNPMTTRQEAFANPRSGHQANAAEAMSLFRSGQASSLKEAWAMVKGEAGHSRRRSRKSRHNPQFQTADFVSACRVCDGDIQLGEAVVALPNGYAHANCR